MEVSLAAFTEDQIRSLIPKRVWGYIDDGTTDDEGEPEQLYVEGRLKDVGDFNGVIVGWVDLDPVKSEYCPDVLSGAAEIDRWVEIPREYLYTDISEEDFPELEETLQKYAALHQLPDDTPLFESSIFSEKSQDDINNALLNAARYNSTGDVIGLIEDGADLETRDEWGRTPLSVAASMGTNVEVVRALVGAGANIDAVDSNGSTSLVLAAAVGKYRTVEYLLKKGASLKGLPTDFIENILPILSPELAAHTKERWNAFHQLPDDTELFERRHDTMHGDSITSIKKTQFDQYFKGEEDTGGMEGSLQEVFDSFKDTLFYAVSAPDFLDTSFVLHFPIKPRGDLTISVVDSEISMDAEWSPRYHAKDIKYEAFMRDIDNLVALILTDIDGVTERVHGNKGVAYLPNKGLPPQGKGYEEIREDEMPKYNETPKGKGGWRGLGDGISWRV